MIELFLNKIHILGDIETRHYFGPEDQGISFEMLKWEPKLKRSLCLTYKNKCNKSIATMNLVYVALLVHTVRCVDIQFKVNSFDIKLETQKREYKFRALTTMAYGQHSNQTNVTAEKILRNTEKSNKTNEDLECTSQDSENKQVEAVLSDMMNQLTLVKLKKYI
ncbi:unnamed protein product [Arctia plantaginis]|uniref:Uncharacterized protein n=1 Tax=Arctia plantaginis TaxID=874455 RepID=A0A8S0YP71_ARCPL|nr:unnamed protein product [Arctia plantaginis]